MQKRLLYWQNHHGFGPTESRAFLRAGLFRSHISAESGGPEGPEEEEEAIDAGGASLDGKHCEPKIAPSCLNYKEHTLRAK